MPTKLNPKELVLTKSIVSNYFKTNEFVNHKLYSINPFFEKREFAWFEYHLCINHIPNESILQSRTIITDDKKYILRGRPEVYLSDDSFDVSDEEFVRGLFHNLYYRNTSENTINNLMKQIQNGTSKKSIYRSFINSEEYKTKKIFSIIDLKDDPFEENEINPLKNISYLLEYEKQLEFLVNI